MKLLHMKCGNWKISDSEYIMRPYIIGISGNMGAGKSTLTMELARDLQSTFLGWDEFDEISNGPDDYVDWYKRGENYSEWDYQKLADALIYLKLGKSIPHPAIRIILNPTEYIIFDAPLGRFHKQTGIYIDTWIHINIPLDVSLCRWLLRDYKETEKTKGELLDELECYINWSRPLFDDATYKTDADLIIDGMLSTKQQVISIKQYLQNSAF